MTDTLPAVLCRVAKGLASAQGYRCKKSEACSSSCLQDKLMRPGDC